MKRAKSISLTLARPRKVIVESKSSDLKMSRANAAGAIGNGFFPRSITESHRTELLKAI